MRRAETVCRLLRTLGVNAQYRAVSDGMDRPVVPNTTPRDMHLNRRVVIHVSFHDLGGWLTSVKRG
jgi:outer membrane protein OmpA-like peptidoglycan-associated protein